LAILRIGGIGTPFQSPAQNTPPAVVCNFERQCNVMKYDWKNIMKEKTTRELYQIATGKSHLDKDAQIEAEYELKNRKLSLENADRIIKKIELESLIQEQENEIGVKSSFFRPNSKEVFPQLLTVSVITIIALIALSLEKNTENKIYLLIFIIAGIALTFKNYFDYKKKMAKEIARKKRINELMREL
jgi:hypothetical protein